MLDFIYYPVSWILWVWHRVFGFVLGPDNGFAWALSVIFLVFTLRLLLYKPFVKQVRTTRQMQELQPQIKELQKKYKNDRQRQAVEMQKLQREHGFNPLMGCLPVLAQAPVFLGLYHVLRSFNRTAEGMGQLGLSPERNRELPNYAFSVEDVNSFLDARIFGAPISAMISMPEHVMQGFVNEAAGLGMPSRWAIIAVSVPLMIIASIATHFNARASVQRQTDVMKANPQTQMMNRLSLWVFPLGVLAFGAFLPIAILLYWVANNVWTYGQQHLVFGRMEREEAEKKRVALEKKASNAPKPGARPKKRNASARQNDRANDSAASETTDASDSDTTDSTTATESTNGSRPKGSGTNGSPDSARAASGRTVAGSGSTRPKKSASGNAGRNRRSGSRKRR
ncbi:membrane protein insertase YidC [Millisia brevis]|uniref:membrane protein insertase YidC n=1 Tax=Millisia brevis TaxID=264148 RepID=UPI00082B7874|nr:membrane protein insertase YidC [Millisia brevis]